MAEVTADILRKVDAIRRQEDRARLAAGWTRTEDDVWIPPGWVRDPALVPPEQGPESPGGDATPRDSV